jgi:hypothetical protein
MFNMFFNGHLSNNFRNSGFSQTQYTYRTGNVEYKVYSSGPSHQSYSFSFGGQSGQGDNSSREHSDIEEEDDYIIRNNVNRNQRRNSKSKQPKRTYINKNKDSSIISYCANVLPALCLLVLLIFSYSVT